MKRFWTEAGIDRGPEGHAILLDGKPMRLPGGAVLLVGPPALAAAIAAEWQAAGGAAGGEMSFADTPLTRLAGTAQERIAPDPWPTVDAIARYGETDLLCYRAETPAILARRQHEAWQPWLDWATRTLDAPLRVASGIVAVRQHQSSIAALRRAVAGQDALALAALGVAVPALGSLVLGLALAAGALDASTAHALGALDELYQAELWGEDADALARRQAAAADIALAERFLALARGGARPDAPEAGGPGAAGGGDGTWQRNG
ncbi:MAG: chaperone, ATP12 [Rhodospirillales bacterium]|nr:chaperone, ATP12 [Rhodospirillales bacterium]